MTVEVPTDILATDRSQETWSIVSGVNGRIVAAAVVFLSGSNDRGQTYVQPLVVRGRVTGTNTMMQLATGYVYPGFVAGGQGSLPIATNDKIVMLTWNSASSLSLILRVTIDLEEDRLHGSSHWDENKDLETRGLIRSIDLGDPAAGSDYADQTVPTGSVWRVMGFVGTLVTNATAANRRVTIPVTDGTDVVYVQNAHFRHQASVTARYSGFSPGIALITQGAVTEDENAIDISPNQIPGGYIIDFVTNNLQAGDNWGDGQLLVEEWISP